MSEPYILILSSNITARVRVSDIVLIERDKRKLHIVTDLEDYEYYEKLENVEPLLDGRFFPCLKGCYINLDKVVSMRNQKIMFSGGQVIYLGRENFVKTMHFYKIYLKKP